MFPFVGLGTTNFVVSVFSQRASSCIVPSVYILCSLVRFTGADSLTNGERKGQNFCSSMTLPSLSTARQCVMFRASEEMVTPHLVSRPPSAS